MDLTTYMMLLSHHDNTNTDNYPHPYYYPGSGSGAGGGGGGGSLYYGPVEPPHSPKFNVTLWQPWLQHHNNYTETLNGSSSSESSSPNGLSNSSSVAGKTVEAVSSKQITSAKWRRERRATTRIPDYKNRDTTISGSKTLRSQSFNERSSRSSAEAIGRPQTRESSAYKSDSDLVNFEERKTKTVPFSSLKAATKSGDFVESPLDMSVKIKNSPPSYTQSLNNGVLFRPSVITQAPINGVAPISPPLNKLDGGKGEYIPGSMSMCDPVIDEHFRRSLGADYMTLFAKNKDSANGKPHKVSTKDRGSSPIMFDSDPCSKFINTSNSLKSPKESSSSSGDEAMDTENSEKDVVDGPPLSVDDHFAKALGDTWKKLQEKNLNKKDSDTNEKDNAKPQEIKKVDPNVV